ncbi:MAG: dynamin family protein [Pleurocapsa sp.]
MTICSFLENPTYRIAVFAPFNHGKSTLLNALLGSKALPIDLIPTTGAAICVSYGEKLRAEIKLKDGTQIKEEGIKILKQYAALDDDRTMKDNVEEVTVFCNHSRLKTCIEFLDLPVTNDREAQNDLVKDKLLSADLIIHVLDARKLMTLEEREHLKDWLQNRGITTVIFVVNFLNLLTPEEQQEVKNRLYFVAESFRSSLPTGISNIYCVDALPALRARLKGNQADAKTTGIVGLESALQAIVSLEQPIQNKLARVIKFSQELLSQATAKKQEIESNIIISQKKENDQIKIKKKAEKLIQQSFARSISDFRGWLYFPKLLANYQPSLAIALQQTRFNEWLESEFKPEVFRQQQVINKWVNQGSNFFQHKNPRLLILNFPASPTIEIPAYDSVEQTDSNSKYKSYIPQELNFLLQKKAGAVVLGGANYLINKIATKSQSTDNNSGNKNTRISAQIYVDAAEKYLKKFSIKVNAEIDEYEKQAHQYTTYILSIKNHQATKNNYQLQLLNNLADNLENEINRLSKS